MIEVTVHRTVFQVGQGSQFFVPRGISKFNIVGNQYLLKNVWDEECQLFFCHGKEVITPS
jgi:hypothetical protein